MAQLSHEAAKVAFHAKFWAELDLRFAAFTPTQLDYDAVAYLDAISRRVGWIALKVEKNPTSPRVSSKRAYDFVAHEAMMLRQRYQPASFRRSGVRIDYLLTLLDQIARYYEQNKQPETLKETMRVGSQQLTVHQTLPRGTNVRCPSAGRSLPKITCKAHGARGEIVPASRPDRTLHHPQAALIEPR